MVAGRSAALGAWLGWAQEASAGAHALEARPVAPSDDGFLRALYADTREPAMRATGWPASRCRNFTDLQFDELQRQQRQRHGDALCLVLLAGGSPIGRLSWHAGERLATLIELALVRAWRGRGIGTAVLQGLTAEADRRGQAIDVHVEPENPAWPWALRFGFEAALPQPSLHLHLRRLPMAASNAC
jgi:GNAT superfamily N-acetyltransferase